MKLLLGLTVPFLLSATSALALVGGPFKGTEGLPDFSTGTWQGILTGKNLTGVIIFGTASDSAAPRPTTTTTGSVGFFGGSTQTTTTDVISSGLGTTGSEGRVAVFVDGLVVVGSTTSTVDFNERRIASVFEASRTRNVTQIDREVVTANTQITAPIPATFNPDGTLNSPARGGELIETLTTTVQPFILNDVLTLSGAFSAKIVEAYPESRFEGTGEVEISEANGIREETLGEPLTVEQGQFGLSTETTTVTQIVPIIEKRSEVFQIKGVRTSFFTPSFSTTVQVQQSTVTRGTAETSTSGGDPGGDSGSGSGN